MTHTAGTGKHTFKSLEEIAQYFKAQAEKCDKEANQVAKSWEPNRTRVIRISRLEVERDTWLIAGGFLRDSEIVKE